VSYFLSLAKDPRLKIFLELAFWGNRSSLSFWRILPAFLGRFLAKEILPPFLNALFVFGNPRYQFFWLDFLQSLGVSNQNWGIWLFVMCLFSSPLEAEEKICWYPFSSSCLLIGSILSSYFWFQEQREVEIKYLTSLGIEKSFINFDWSFKGLCRGFINIFDHCVIGFLWFWWRIRNHCCGSNNCLKREWLSLAIFEVIHFPR